MDGSINYYEEWGKSGVNPQPSKHNCKSFTNTLHILLAQ